MIVWIELRNGTRNIYDNVNRIVERSGHVEIRSGAGMAEKIVMVYEKAEIKNLGNSTMLPRPRLKRFFE